MPGCVISFKPVKIWPRPRKKLPIILLIFLSLPLFAQDEKEEKEEKDSAFRIGKSPEEKADKIIKNAVETIDGMDDPDSGIPLALVRKSGGIIIFPKATKAQASQGSFVDVTSYSVGQSRSRLVACVGQIWKLS